MSTVADNIQARPQRKAPKYAALFDAYDQGQVRADLAAFFGPNADVYLATYHAVSADRTSSPDAELVEKVDQLVSRGAIGFIAGSALQSQRTVQPIS